MTIGEFFNKWTGSLSQNDKELFYKDLVLLNEPEEPSDDKIDQFIESWKSLWPTNQQMAFYGYPSKVLMDPKAVKTRMRTFLKDFKKNTGVSVSFEEKCDLILRATKQYIGSFMSGQQQWTYIKKAHYFISKDGESELLSYITRNRVRKTEDPNIQKTNQDLKFS